MGDELALLAAEVRRIQGILDGFDGKLRDFMSGGIARIGRDAVSASYVALLLESTYTALETLFLRISQFFENSLAAERWHADLLDSDTSTSSTGSPRSRSAARAEGRVSRRGRRREKPLRAG